MKLRRSVFMTGILAVVLASVAIPMTATATTPPVQTSAAQPTGWPIANTAKTNSQIIVGDDKIASINCDGASSYDTMTFTDASGTTPTQSVMPPASVSGNSCSTYGRSSAWEGFTVSPDGTMFSNANLSSSTTGIIAYKNGRQLWATTLTSTINCANSPYTDYTMKLKSMSVGSDGNLYGILTGVTTNGPCGAFLAGYDRHDGHELFRTSLTTGYATNNTSRAWTYSDHITVLDWSMKVHEYSYLGVEDTAKQYTFPYVSGMSFISNAYANTDGRVFALYLMSGSYRVAFHDRDNTNASMSVPYYTSYMQFAPGGNGGLIAYIGSDVYDIDIATNSFNQVTLPMPSGYTSQATLGYMEDTNGIGLLVRTVHTSSSYSNAIMVDTIDPSTAALTNIFTLAGDSGASFAPSSLLSYSGDSVFGNNLYLTICYNNGCSGSTPTAQDMSMYKVALTGFGDVVTDRNNQSPYVSTELNYVAMGDSYSSGEGSFNYDLGSGGCHRSTDSYPYYLESHNSVDMRRFVACSGAVTDDLYSANPVNTTENAQLSYLGTSTSLVTLTIGGNDLGFSDIMSACADGAPITGASGWGCSTNTSITTAVNARMDALSGMVGASATSPSGRTIHSLKSILQSIATASPGVQIYIGGYPHLFGTSISDYSSAPSAPGGAACTVATWYSLDVTYSYDDAQWINNEIGEINSTIQDAVAYAQLQGIDATYVPVTNFNYHGLCDSQSSYINGVVLSGSATSPDKKSESFHPTTTGISSGYGAMFSSKITAH